MASTNDHTDTTPKKETIQLEFSYEYEGAAGENKVTKVRKLDISPARHRQCEAIISGNSNSSRDGVGHTLGQTQDGFSDKENGDSRHSLADDNSKGGRRVLPESTDSKGFLHGGADSRHSLPGDSRLPVQGGGGDSRGGDSRQSLPDSDMRRPEPSSKRKATPTKNKAQATLKKRKSEKKDHEIMSTPPPKASPNDVASDAPHFPSPPPTHVIPSSLEASPSPTAASAAPTVLSPPLASVATLEVLSSPPAGAILQASISSPANGAITQEIPC
jgi:hypothetical protein